jgi:hypothetical protein
MNLPYDMRDSQGVVGQNGNILRQGAVFGLDMIVTSEKLRDLRPITCISYVETAALTRADLGIRTSFNLPTSMCAMGVQLSHIHVRVALSQMRLPRIARTAESFSDAPRCSSPSSACSLTSPRSAQHERCPLWDSRRTVAC